MGAHRTATKPAARRAGVVAGLVGLGVLGATAPAFAGDAASTSEGGTSVTFNNDNRNSVNDDRLDAFDDRLDDAEDDIDALEEDQADEDARLAVLTPASTNAGIVGALLG